MDYTFELNNARKDSNFASGKIHAPPECHPASRRLFFRGTADNAPRVYRAGQKRKRPSAFRELDT